MQPQRSVSPQVKKQLCVHYGVGGWSDACAVTRVWMSNQLCVVGFLFLPLCKFQGLNPGSRVYTASTLPTSPSCQSKPTYFYQDGQAGFLFFLTDPVF